VNRQNIIILGGVLLVIISGSLALLSPAFNYDYPLRAMPIRTMVLLMMIAGGIYFALLFLIPALKSSARLMMFIFSTGVVLRLLMIPTTPVLEDDFYRYLWDGAMVAHGINPYRYVPQDVQEAIKQSDGVVPEEIRQLGIEAGYVLQRVNHPHLRTIYPPVAQLFFGISHLLKPWSLPAWRVILLLVDILNVLLLFKILRFVGVSPIFLLIYWWNPLLIKEIFNSGHMDILIFPFLLGAIYLYLKNRWSGATVLLSLAAGVKIWPVLFLPLFLKPLKIYPAKLIFTFLGVLLIFLILFLPVYFTGLDNTSGFSAYSEKWEMNDALFMAVVWGFSRVLPLFSIHPGFSQVAARILMGLVLIVLISMLTIRIKSDRHIFFRYLLIVIAVLFFLSPTQFPWYYTWMIPLLVLVPRRSLLLLTVLMPVYYLRYYLAARGQASLFDNWIVWAEYLPVWGYILWESVRGIGSPKTHVSTQPEK